MLRYWLIGNSFSLYLRVCGTWWFHQCIVYIHTVFVCRFILAGCIGIYSGRAGFLMPFLPKFFRVTGGQQNGWGSLSITLLMSLGLSIYIVDMDGARYDAIGHC